MSFKKSKEWHGLLKVIANLGHIIGSTIKKVGKSNIYFICQHDLEADTVGSRRVQDDPMESLSIYLLLYREESTSRWITAF